MVIDKLFFGSVQTENLKDEFDKYAVTMQFACQTDITMINQQPNVFENIHGFMGKNVFPYLPFACCYAIAVYPISRTANFVKIIF